jgi:hypothetical protein
MSTFCAVESCSAEGAHEIDAEHSLCLRHAQAWDGDESARLGRLMELQFANPAAADEVVWALCVAEWLGREAAP